MKRAVSVLMMLVPVICTALIIKQTGSVIHRVTASNKTSHLTAIDSLRQSVMSVEQAAKIRLNVDSNSSRADSPFKLNKPVVAAVFHEPVASVEPVITFNREPLQVQGILKGSKPIAVLVDKAGTTYFLKVGESLFNRKVTAITSGGVTLIDSAGSETVALP